MPPRESRAQLDAYKAANMTLPPAYRIVILYDGIIGFLRKAREAALGGRIEERHDYVGKAAAIVDGLQNCLDHEQGGQAAEELHRFYTLAFLRIMRIDIENDPRICDGLITKFIDMRGAWAQLARIASASGPGSDVSRHPRDAIGPTSLSA
jgi:flagellar protein FliS